MTFEGVGILSESDGKPPKGFQREAVGPGSCLENSWTVASVRLNREEATVSNSQEGDPGALVRMEGDDGRGERKLM